MILYNDVSSFRRKRLVFSDNNFQDYEFTRLNTHVKKEMSEELTIILSNNYYWNQFLEIIGNYCPRKMRLAASYKLFLFTYLFMNTGYAELKVRC